MKYISALLVLMCVTALNAAPKEALNVTPTGGVSEMKPVAIHAVDVHSQCATKDEPVLKVNKTMLVSVVGQGVAPVKTATPAQAFALAKRAAIADGYRLIAEKIQGVRVDGRDLIKNMMVKRTTVRTAVAAMVKNSNIVETNYKDGLCEVEMEILISYSQFQ